MLIFLLLFQIQVQVFMGKLASSHPLFLKEKKNLAALLRFTVECVNLENVSPLIAVMVCRYALIWTY